MATHYDSVILDTQKYALCQGITMNGMVIFIPIRNAHYQSVMIDTQGYALCQVHISVHLIIDANECALLHLR